MIVIFNVFHFKREFLPRSICTLFLHFRPRNSDLGISSSIPHKHRLAICGLRVCALTISGRRRTSICLLNTASGSVQPPLLQFDFVCSPLNVGLHTVFTRPRSSEAKLLLSWWYRSLENIIEAVGFCARMIFDAPNSGPALLSVSALHLLPAVRLLQIARRSHGWISISFISTYAYLILG